MVFTKSTNVKLYDALIGLLVLTIVFVRFSSCWYICQRRRHDTTINVRALLNSNVTVNQLRAAVTFVMFVTRVLFRSRQNGAFCT